MTGLQVVKIGGHLIEQEDKINDFIQQFTLLPSPKILVHGGGKKASDLSKSLGIEVEMVEGRRVTKEADLEVAVMVYAGLINKKIVAQLQHQGTNALGVTGADLNLIKAVQRPKQPIDFGLVGDIDTQSVNKQSLIGLLNAGITPVFSALTHDAKGQLLNTNADTIAAALASSLTNVYHVSLNYCFEQMGVLNSGGQLIKKLPYTDFLNKKEQGIIKDGMIPKLSNAYDALNSGVKQVWVKAADNISNDLGTQITL